MNLCNNPSISFLAIPTFTTMAIYVTYEHYHPDIYKAFYEDLTLEYLDGCLGDLRTILIDHNKLNEYEANKIYNHQNNFLFKNDT